MLYGFCSSDIQVYSFELIITVFITDSKTCEQLNEALVSGHCKLCPWPDNPCPGMFKALNKNLLLIQQINKCCKMWAR